MNMSSDVHFDNRITKNMYSLSADVTWW